MVGGSARSVPDRGKDQQLIVGIVEQPSQLRVLQGKRYRVLLLFLHVNFSALGSLPPQAYRGFPHVSLQQTGICVEQDFEKKQPLC